MEKPHYHIIMRVTGRNAISISAWLRMVGVEYRKELDDALWDNRGVEGTRNFANAAMYLTHETDQAIRDGKTRYEMTELVSNLTLEEIKKVRKDIFGLPMHPAKWTCRKCLNWIIWHTKRDMICRTIMTGIRRCRLRLGRNSAMRTVEKSFYLGVQDRAKERQDLNRLLRVYPRRSKHWKDLCGRRSIKGNEGAARRRRRNRKV